MERCYYVYEHIRLDNMTCFYVGKGKNDRAYEKGRNKHHDAIASKFGYAVVIVGENLSEKEAHNLEKEIIEEYVFELGYGIDIKGFRNCTDKFYLTNATFGGEGCSGRTVSEETKIKLRKANLGRKQSENCILINRMKHFGKKHTDEAKKKIGLASIGRNAGSENWKARKVICLNNKEIFETLTEAYRKYNIFQSDIVQCCSHIRKYSGELNGEHLVWMYYDEYLKSSEYEISNYLKEGLKNKNHQSHKIICININKVFDSIEEAKEFCNMKSGSSIGSCCKGKRKTAGKFNGEKLKWMYYSEYKKVVSL